MEKKRKKKSTFGTFYQMSPGNVEQNIERFNNSVQDGGMKTVCAEDLELREDNNSLTPQERQELKNLINTANDIDAITSYINAKIQDKKGMNEALSLSEDEFDISNDGPSLSQDRINKMFKPFEKGDKGKFGLGLSICYKVCNTYGYSIEAENLEKGVIFRIKNTDLQKKEKKKWTYNKSENHQIKLK